MADDQRLRVAYMITAIPARHTWAPITSPRQAGSHRRPCHPGDRPGHTDPAVHGEDAPKVVVGLESGHHPIRAQRGYAIADPDPALVLAEKQSSAVDGTFRRGDLSSWLAGRFRAPSRRYWRTTAQR